MTARSLLVSFLLCLAFPYADARAADPLDDEIAAHMQEASIVGMAAAILIDGKPVWSKGYGYADKQRRTPFTPDTVLNLGSISKTVTGVAMLRAVEEGKLSLDADINTWLPFKVINPYRPDAKITLRHLATHASGITDRWVVYDATYHYGDDKPESLDAFLRAYFVPGGKYYARENFLDFAPGAHSEYSNIGAALAGYIVERVVGESLPDYAKAHIFEPLHMDATVWRLADVDRSRHATLYAQQNGFTFPIPLYEGTTYPDGGVRSSVADLSKFFGALLRDGAPILKTASVREMQRLQFDATNKPDNLDLTERNFGLFWKTAFNTTRVGHGGSDPGIRTEMYAGPDRHIGVIVLYNTSLSEEDLKHQAQIFQALWKRAEAMR